MARILDFPFLGFRRKTFVGIAFLKRGFPLIDRPRRARQMGSVPRRTLVTATVLAAALAGCGPGASNPQQVSSGGCQSGQQATNCPNGATVCCPSGYQNCIPNLHDSSSCTGDVCCTAFHPECAKQTACGSCASATGCGWCKSTNTCSDNPGHCSSWTWTPSGC
jgi:hypothetical protein